MARKANATTIRRKKLLLRLERVLGPGQFEDLKRTLDRETRGTERANKR